MKKLIALTLCSMLMTAHVAKAEDAAATAAGKADTAKEQSAEAGKEGGKHGKGGYFKMMDTNGDGAIDKAESAAANEKRFAKMDANGDGKITPDEMKKGKHGGKHDGMKRKRGGDDAAEGEAKTEKFP